MRTTFIALAAGLLLTLIASAAPAVAAPGPLRIVGTPKLAYWTHPTAKDGTGSKEVFYQFQTNRRLRKGWTLKLNGMSVLFVNRGDEGACYSGQFGVGTDTMQGIYRLMRPGKLATLEVREPKPLRKAHRGVRAQRSPGPHAIREATAAACRK